MTSSDKMLNCNVPTGIARPNPSTESNVAAALPSLAPISTAHFGASSSIAPSLHETAPPLSPVGPVPLGQADVDRVREYVQRQMDARTERETLPETLQPPMIAPAPVVATSNERLDIPDINIAASPETNGGDSTSTVSLNRDVSPGSVRRNPSEPKVSAALSPLTPISTVQSNHHFGATSSSAPSSHRAAPPLNPGRPVLLEQGDLGRVLEYVRQQMDAKAETKTSLDTSWPPMIPSAPAAATSNKRPDIPNMNIAASYETDGGDPTSAAPQSSTLSTESGPFPTSLALRANGDPDLIANGAVSSLGLLGPTSSHTSSSLTLATDEPISASKLARGKTVARNEDMKTLSTCMFPFMLRAKLSLN